MELPFSGGCQCGALRYECTEAPRFTVNCHCTACQKTSGASYVSVLNVPISLSVSLGKCVALCESVTRAVGWRMASARSAARACSATRSHWMRT